jgi:ribulose-phosphate 3-epimerase
VKILIAPSLMCSDFRNLEAEVNLFERNGLELLHFDVMDGHFVPNLMLGPGMIRAVSAMTRLTPDVHMMVENPEHFLPALALPGKRPLISVHVEIGRKVEGLIRAIRAQDGRPAVAISPHTPIRALAPLLPTVEMVLVMAVRPGHAGQEMLPEAIERIAELKEMISRSGVSALIEVDGNTSFENIRRMAAAGANVIVAGSSCLYRKGVPLEAALEELIGFVASL